MDGLEIIEISFAEYCQTYRLRLDSEYYLKQFLANERFLNAEKTIKDFCVGNVQNIRNTPPDKPFNYLEISNVSLDGLEYHPTEVDTQDIPDRATYVLQSGDIAVSTVRPNRNAVAFIRPMESLVGTSGFTILRVDKDKISPHFLYVFCKTKHFVARLMRENTATMYPAVSDYDVLNVPVPSFTKRFQKKITDVIESAGQFLDNACNFYSSAESLLLSALGLSDFEPSQDPVAVKTLSESLGTSGRLDAEYYQKKYDDLFQRLSGFKCAKLGGMVSIMKSIEPGSEYYSDEGVPFVRVSDVTKFGIRQPDIKIPASIGKSHLYPKRETILLSKDGTVGIAYKAEEDLTCVTSGALLHLTVKSDVLPDYLTLILNSLVVQMQAERDAGGSVIQHWKPSEIAEVVIPILDTQTQKRFSADVQRSFALRCRSEHLVEVAKQAVETAIENGEKKAISPLYILIEQKENK